MIGRICLWIVRRAVAHDKSAWEEIIAGTEINSSNYCYRTDVRTMQNRIARHWGYM